MRKASQRVKNHTGYDKRMNALLRRSPMSVNPQALALAVLALHGTVVLLHYQDAGPNELELAIQATMRGETYLDSRVSTKLADYMRRAGVSSNPLERLTSRQREVLQLIAQGYSTKDIAKQLDLSVKTVEAHRSQIMGTLEIHDVPGLVRFAIRHGLISAEA